MTKLKFLSLSQFSPKDSNIPQADETEKKTQNGKIIRNAPARFRSGLGPVHWPVGGVLQDLWRAVLQPGGSDLLPRRGPLQKRRPRVLRHQALQSGVLSVLPLADSSKGKALLEETAARLRRIRQLSKQFSLTLTLFYFRFSFDILIKTFHQEQKMQRDQIFQTVVKPKTLILSGYSTIKINMRQYFEPFTVASLKIDCTNESDENCWQFDVWFICVLIFDCCCLKIETHITLFHNWQINN